MIVKFKTIQPKKGNIIIEYKLVISTYFQCNVVVHFSINIVFIICLFVDFMCIFMLPKGGKHIVASLSVCPSGILSGK